MCVTPHPHAHTCPVLSCPAVLLCRLPLSSTQLKAGLVLVHSFLVPSWTAGYYSSVSLQCTLLSRCSRNRHPVSLTGMCSKSAWFLSEVHYGVMDPSPCRASWPGSSATSISRAVCGTSRVLMLPLCHWNRGCCTNRCHHPKFNFEDGNQCLRQQCRFVYIKV